MTADSSRLSVSETQLVPSVSEYSHWQRLALDNPLSFQTGCFNFSWDLSLCLFGSVRAQLLLPPAATLQLCGGIQHSAGGRLGHVDPGASRSNSRFRTRIMRLKAFLKEQLSPGGWNPCIWEQIPRVLLGYLGITNCAKR